MLIPTRCLQQSCLIDGNIEVIVLAIDGDRVRLGFKAPEEVSVLRSELVQGDAPVRRAKMRSPQRR